MTMRRVQIEEARKRLDELLDRAQFAAEPTLIMRGHTTAAVLAPASWYHDKGWISEHETYDSSDFDSDDEDDYEYEYTSSGPRELDAGPDIAELYRSAGPPELEA